MHYCLLKYRRRHLLVLDDLVNTWTGKALPKQHLQFNENSLTQKNSSLNRCRVDCIGDVACFIINQQLYQKETENNLCIMFWNVTV